MRSVLTGLLIMVLGLGVVEMPLAEVEMRESIRDRASRIIRFLMGDKGAREIDIVLNKAEPKTVNGRVLIRLLGDSWRGVFDGESACLYEFSRQHMKDGEKEATKGLTHDDAISAEEAFASFLPLAQELKIPMKQEEYSLRFVDVNEIPADNGKKSAKADLYGAYWHLTLSLSYEGMPCRGRRVTARISAYSGRINLFLYYPVIVPSPGERRVDRKQAVRLLKKWLEKKTYFSGPYREHRIPDDSKLRGKLVVACPNGFPDSRISHEQRISPPAASVCWEVAFEYSERGHWFPAVVWVDADTGHVIGGTQRYFP